MEKVKIVEKAENFLKKFFENEKWDTFAEDFKNDCVDIYSSGFEAGMLAGETNAGRKESEIEKRPE